MPVLVWSFAPVPKKVSLKFSRRHQYLSKEPTTPLVKLRFVFSLVQESAPPRICGFFTFHCGSLVLKNKKVCKFKI